MTFADDGNSARKLLPPLVGGSSDDRTDNIGVQDA